MTSVNINPVQQHVWQQKFTGSSDGTQVTATPSAGGFYPSYN